MRLITGIENDKKDMIGYSLSFLLAAACMYIILINLNMAGSGEFCILFGDLRENYIPAIRNLCRDIMNGESIFYSWNTSMGMNTSLYNAYYAINPFNLLYLLFYNGDDAAITVAIVVIKTGLASSCFYRYIRKSHGICRDWGIVASLFYSLCAFQVSYNSTNIIWLDAMFVLPLVFLGIDRLYSEGKIGGLILWYAYIFTTQFYMGYMIGGISCLYFALKLLVLKRDEESKHKIRLLSKYVVAVLMGVGLSAWVWMPTACFLFYNNPGDATDFEGLKTLLTEFYRAFFAGEISGIDATVPNLYSGVLMIIVLPLYIGVKKLDIHQRIIYLILLLFVSVSCFVNPLYKLWHGFDNPDGWTYRFAYIISFLVCIMAVDAIEKMGKEEVKYLILSSVICTGLYIYLALKDDISRENIALNICLILLWFVLIVGYKCLINNYIQKAIGILAIVCTFGELCFNYYDQELLKSDTLKNEYRLWNLTQRETIEELKKDNDLYRVNYLYDLGLCSGTYFGYNSMAHYSTAENPMVRTTMGKLGLAHAPRVLLNFGLTPVTEMLFDVRYDVYGAVYREGMTAEDTYARIEPIDKTLNIGYMVAGNAEDYHLDSKNVFENNNYLLSVMTDKEIKVFEDITEDRIKIEENGVNLQKTDEYYIVEAVPPDQRSGDVDITYWVDSDKEAYAYVDQEVSVLMNKGFILEGGYENAIQYCGGLSLSYIKALENYEKGQALKIVPVDNAWRQSYENIYFAESNKEELNVAYDVLKENQFNVDSFEDGIVNGRVISTEKKQLLFTSIPYDRGWSVIIDGNAGEIIPILDETFCAVKLPDIGEHTLRFEYEAPGKWIGFVISVITGIVYLAYMVYNKRKLKKN